MKKILIVVAGAALTVFLTLFFFLTPVQVISIINTVQGKVIFSTVSAGGNFVTGYHYGKATLSKYDGTPLLTLDEMALDLGLFPLLRGRLGIHIRSKEITADVSSGFDGSADGQVVFDTLPFDSSAFIISENISFTAPLSGRVILLGRKADIEVRTGEITWKKLSSAGFDLPTDIFLTGTGGISVERDKTIVKSLAFEGGKGFARLSGQIISGKKNLTLELFPKDWNDLMLLPFERYKVSPGQYRMPLDF